jgi:hypothetical protein
MMGNGKLFGTVLAIALLGMTFVPAASAGDPVEDGWETYEDTRDEALGVYDDAGDVVDEAVCQVLKGGDDSAWGCIQVFYCGGDHCIERKIWSP